MKNTFKKSCFLSHILYILKHKSFDKSKFDIWKIQNIKKTIDLKKKTDS